MRIGLLELDLVWSKSKKIVTSTFLLPSISLVILAINGIFYH